MELSRYGREYYKQRITTIPATLPTAWEASFNAGSTWITAAAGTDDTGATVSEWLLAGPSADLGTAVAVINASLTPMVRLIDNPEIVVRQASEIRLY